jgi:hypothetical protein
MYTPVGNDFFGMNSYTPPDHILRLLRSGLGVSQIQERCPEVGEAEVHAAMEYTAVIASMQLRQIQPKIKPKEDDEEAAIEAWLEKRKKARADADKKTAPQAAKTPSPAARALPKR